LAKKNDVTEIKETKDAIIFKANKPLTETEFKLLSDLIKSEEEKTGLKIVLMPYSCDYKE
jgi:hypothetical protein